MTVTTETNRWSYTGDAVTTAFAYTSKIFDDDDLKVYLETISSGTLTLQTKTTHYTVSGVGSASGGNVTFVSAPSALYRVIIVRDVPYSQETDLVDDGPFPADTTETGLDKVTVLTQQLSYKAGRTIRQPDNDSSAISALPIASARASKILGFGSGGDVTTYAVSEVGDLVDLTGQGGKYRRVNSGATALEFVAPSSVLTDIGAQPLDSDLTAIAALSTTAYGRAFLALADQAALAALLAAGTIPGALALQGLLDISHASGGQIKFPASQNASADANTLDDYEEGTWTPALTFATPGDLSVTYSTQQGRYTKIGREVKLTFALVTSAFTHTTASGNSIITGSPFTAAAAPVDLGVFGWRGITKANYTQVNIVTNASSSNLSPIGYGSGQVNTNITAADMPTGGTVNFRGTLWFTV